MEVEVLNAWVTEDEGAALASSCSTRRARSRRAPGPLVDLVDHNHMSMGPPQISSRANAAARAVPACPRDAAVIEASESYKPTLHASGWRHRRNEASCHVGELNSRSSPSAIGRSASTTVPALIGHRLAGDGARGRSGSRPSAQPFTPKAGVPSARR